MIDKNFTDKIIEKMSIKLINDEIQKREFFKELEKGENIEN